MKATNTLLAIIAVLLAVNCFFSYRGALVYDRLPYSKMDQETFSKCLSAEAAGNGNMGCPHGWYLKGTD